MTHTPEPLAYREADEEEQYMRGCDFVIEQRDFTDNCKQIVAYCDDEHDASRIVACVNACAGIPTGDLAVLVGCAINDIRKQNAALSAQVEELVAVIEDAYQHLAVCRSSPEEMWKLFLRIEAERNKAITKAGSHE